MPVEKPLPEQEVALVDDQERIDDWPLEIEVGFAESVAVGPVPVEVTVSVPIW